MTLHTQEGVSFYETLTAGSGESIVGMVKEFSRFILTGHYHVVSRATVRLADEKVSRDIRLRWVDDCLESCCTRLKSCLSRLVPPVLRRQKGSKVKVDDKIETERDIHEYNV